MNGSRSLLVLLGVLLAPPVMAQAPGGNEIKAWLGSYDDAFNAKDLTRLAVFYHPDVTIFEGGGVNTGWADYRDHHLGPELEEMQQPAFSHSNVVVNMLDKGGHSAYVTSEYRLRARVKDRDVDASGLETLVVVRGRDGAWKIRHSHTSSRRRPSSPAPPGAGGGSE